MNYELKQMPPEELTRLYPILTRDFPAEERKSYNHIKRQLESGLETAWLILAGEREVGYALIISHPMTQFVLLDYLAILPQERGQGHGSACLKLLQAQYPQGILAEVEDVGPEFSPEENTLRRRRFAFYRREGFVPVPFENSIFTVRYLVHLWCPEPLVRPSRDAAHALSTLYALQLPAEAYCRNVHITLPSEG